jgi:hypothetical protein
MGTISLRVGLEMGLPVGWPTGVVQAPTKEAKPEDKSAYAMVAFIVVDGFYYALSDGAGMLQRDPDDNRCNFKRRAN